MRTSQAIAAVSASLGLAAHAGEGLDFSPKAQAVTSSAAISSAAAVSSAPALAPPAAAPHNVLAPFTAVRNPLPDLSPTREEPKLLRGPRGACESPTVDVCYDLTEGRIVFRPVRRYMPKLGELEPDSVSLRPNRITFRYTFK
jgi:hypothetical protein